MAGRVTVDAEALGKFIAYANSAREARDSELCCSWEEHAAADAEFQAEVASLDVLYPGARRLARRDNRKLRRASHERLSL